MKEVNDLIRSLNIISQRIIDSDGDDSLWTEYDQLSRELYQLVNCYNECCGNGCLVIHTMGSAIGVPLLYAEERGHIFDIVTYEIEIINLNKI